MDLFFQEMNGGLKVTIKVKVKYNLLPQSLQTLAKVNSVDNTYISNRKLFPKFNSFHVKMVNLQMYGNCLLKKRMKVFK
jgi:hypothetical protein